MNIERFTMEMLKKKREEKTLLDKNIFHEKMMNYIYRELEENCLESVVLIVHKGFRHKEYYSKYKNNVKTPILDIHQKIVDQLKEDGYDVKIEIVHKENSRGGIDTSIWLNIPLEQFRNVQKINFL